MTKKRLSENFSDNKRSRGRPPLLNKVWHDFYAKNAPVGASERTIQNMSYYLRAFSLLQPEPWANGWLIDYPSKAGHHGNVRRTILTELGRIEDDETLIAVAQELCELQPTTKEAIALIRHWREVQKPLDLTASLQRTLNAYLQAHPMVTLEEMAEALLNIADMIDQQIAAPPKKFGPGSSEGK